MIVHYEALIEDTEQTLKAIGIFLGAPPAQHRHEDKRSYVVGSRYDSNLHRNIDKPPLHERITAWRDDLSGEEIAAFESVAYRELRREGYRLSTRYQDQSRGFLG